MIAQARPPFDDANPTRKRRILGIRVDDLSWDEALTRIDGLIAERGRFVVTPNPEMLMAARRNSAARDAIERADLATADGVGLRWAGRLLRQPLREIIPGSSLVLRLAERGAPKRQRWFLLGAAPGVADEAGAMLETDYPGITIAGTHGGTARPSEDHVTRSLIADAGPIDVLLVAYGSPAQEIWLERNIEHLDVGVAVGVGGTFNFIAGHSRWPPDWVRRLQVIWLWRLVTEPWRWRRQLVLVRFVGAVVREAVREAL